MKVPFCNEHSLTNTLLRVVEVKCPRNESKISHGNEAKKCKNALFSNAFQSSSLSPPPPSSS